MTTHQGKLTKLRPITLGFREEPERPVMGLCMTVDNAVCQAPHAHPRGQLLYASHGLVRVSTPAGAWLVPPSQAVWIPPHVLHEVTLPGAVTLHSLFVSEAAAAHLFGKCSVIQVSSLFREMILRAGSLGADYQPDTPADRFMRVLLDEMAQATVTEIGLPMSTEPRVKRVMDTLAERPGLAFSMAELAQVACASERTLARLFAKEVGMSVGDWHRRLMVQYALTSLDAGHSVQRVALSLGYTDSSSFIEMFRGVMGRAPGQFIGQRGARHGGAS
ncbi:MAG: AraC family transcriptional regulator [Aquabacterium sp.]|uniref:AraC family transcriptional regulator n=1 Tax=Aquabacterium sp. TaxID=1872578 RepID=UPI003BDE5E34